MVEILKPPKALVLTAPGINRDESTKYAYEAAGGRADIIHINQILHEGFKISDYQIFSIPGGFSSGDHIQSGRVMALQLQQNIITDQIYSHLENGRIVLGVCNGFQILVQSGLLPFGKIHPLYENKSTLTTNKPDRFQSRWVNIKPQESKCLFVHEDQPMTLTVAHGEGRLLGKIPENQIVYRYCTTEGIPIESYPENPNGSPSAIAGICDPSGQILGMMPHAEDFVRREHRPNWRRYGKDQKIDGLEFFKAIVSYASQL